jgi:hypothetical protein
MVSGRENLHVAYEEFKWVVSTEINPKEEKSHYRAVKEK